MTSSEHAGAGAAGDRSDVDEALERLVEEALERSEHLREMQGATQDSGAPRG